MLNLSDLSQIEAVQDNINQRGVEGASIVSLEKSNRGYKGTAVWEEGDTFVFECEDDLDKLQDWAISVWLSKAA